MNELRRVFILAICFFGFINLQAQSEKADAVYLKLVKEYILQKDGSTEFHYHKEIKLLSYFAIHRLFGETFIVYNQDYQKLKINDCYTIMADGRKVIAPQNAFNEVLPGFAADAAAYNHLREMVVTHTGLERNAVITLDYTISTSSSFMPYMMGAEDILEDVPVKELDILVKIPGEVTLTYNLLNNTATPAKTQEQGFTAYHWNFSDLPPRPQDAMQDAGHLPRLYFSTARDLASAYFDFVNQASYRADLSPEMSKAVDQVVIDKKNDLDIILALQDIVVNNIKTLYIPPKYIAYKVRTPEEMWKSGNATQLEKSILFAKLLVKSGSNAVPVTLIPNYAYDKNMGNLLLFENFYVQVNPKKLGRLYLSVNQLNDQNYIYDLQNYTILALEGAGESLRTFREKDDKNRIEFSGNMTVIDTSRITGDFKLGLSGYKNPYFKLERDSSKVKGLLAGGLNSANINKFNIDMLTQPKSVTNFNIEKNNAFRKEGDYLFFDLPKIAGDVDAWQLGMLSEKRDIAIMLPQPLSQSYEFTIDLPEGYRMVTPVTLTEIRNEMGSVNISFSQDGSHIKILRAIEFPVQIIEPQSCKAFRELVNAWDNKAFKELVISIK
jgi:hypothetical protein